VKCLDDGTVMRGDGCTSCGDCAMYDYTAATGGRATCELHGPDGSYSYSYSHSYSYSYGQGVTATYYLDGVEQAVEECWYDDCSEDEDEDWRWANGCRQDYCTSMGDDCYASMDWGEPATCSNGYTPTPPSPPGHDPEYTCCPSATSCEYVAGQPFVLVAFEPDPATQAMLGLPDGEFSVGLNDADRSYIIEETTPNVHSNTFVTAQTTEGTKMLQVVCSNPTCPDGSAATCCDVDGDCDDGDDDWCCGADYYCSNDGAEYAAAMGGVLCCSLGHANGGITFPDMPDEWTTDDAWERVHLVRRLRSLRPYGADRRPIDL